MSLSKLDEYILAHLDDSIAELSLLCAQPSVSAQGLGIRECAALVADRVRVRGFHVEIHETRGNPVVYGEIAGKGDRTLLLYNHYDVQPAEPLELWDSPPFEPAVRDGKLFARGASDDKGHIECRLAAIDALKAVYGELPCRIKFVIEGEEEVSSVSLPDYVRDNAARLAADACIWEFGGLDTTGKPILSLGMRGICYVELVARTGTLDAHSGLGGSIFPNAAWRLTWALASLKGPDERIRIPGYYDNVVPPTVRDLELLRLLPDESEHHKRAYGLQGFLKNLSGEDLKREAVFLPTCTICGLTAGYEGPGSKTVLPAGAVAKVDFRLVPDQTPAEVLRKLRAHLDAEGFADIEIRLLGGESPGRTDPDDPFIRMVADTARDVYGEPAQLEPMIGGSGPNHVFIEYLHVPIATVGIGYPDSRTHAPNENIVLTNFVQGTQYTARIIERFANM